VLLLEVEDFALSALSVVRQPEHQTLKFFEDFVVVVLDLQAIDSLKDQSWTKK
jgi:hypothetical protein